MKIFIFIPPINQNKSIETQSSDTIGSLKVKLDEKQNIPFEEQKLEFGGEELEDGCTLASYNIQHKSTVVLHCHQKWHILHLLDRLTTQESNINEQFMKILKIKEVLTNFKINTLETDGFYPLKLEEMNHSLLELALQCCKIKIDIGNIKCTMVQLFCHLTTAELSRTELSGVDCQQRKIKKRKRANFPPFSFLSSLGKKKKHCRYNK